MSMKYNHNTQQCDATKKRCKQFQTMPDGESLTVQAEKDACCVNNIMAKYRQTGLVTHVNERQGRYEDVSTAPQFQEAMNIVVEAQRSFDLLPAEIRKRFDHDPAEFLKFVHDPENKGEMVKMGLSNAPVITPEPTPVLVRIQNPDAPPAAS